MSGQPPCRVVIVYRATTGGAFITEPTVIKKFLDHRDKIAAEPEPLSRALSLIETGAPPGRATRLSRGRIPLCPKANPKALHVPLPRTLARFHFSTAQ